VKMLLNSGVDISTNTTIIPRSVFDEITTAHAIVQGMPSVSSLSIVGYGMGWARLSLEGHDVSQTSHFFCFCVLSPLVIFSQSCTKEEYPVRFTSLSINILTQNNNNKTGSSTLVSLFPGNGVGVVVLVNADSKAPAYAAVMKRVVDDMLGIKADRYFVLLHYISSPFSNNLQRYSETVTTTAAACTTFAQHAKLLG